MAAVKQNNDPLSTERPRNQICNAAIQSSCAKTTHLRCSAVNKCRLEPLVVITSGGGEEHGGMFRDVKKPSDG